MGKKAQRQMWSQNSVGGEVVEDGHSHGTHPEGRNMETKG